MHTSSKQKSKSNNSPENKSIDTHNSRPETPSTPNPVSPGTKSGNKSISLDVQTSGGRDSGSNSKTPIPLETPKPSNSGATKPKSNASVQTSAKEDTVSKRIQSQSKEQTEKS